MDILEFEHRLSVRNGIQVMTVAFRRRWPGDESPVVAGVGTVAGISVQMGDHPMERLAGRVGRLLGGSTSRYAVIASASQTR
jgi:hypothetical protein